jgi:hypothetical protein
MIRSARMKLRGQSEPGIRQAGIRATPPASLDAGRKSTGYEERNSVGNGAQTCDCRGMAEFAKSGTAAHSTSNRLRQIRTSAATITFPTGQTALRNHNNAGNHQSHLPVHRTPGTSAGGTLAATGCESVSAAMLRPWDPEPLLGESRHRPLRGAR